MRPKGHSSLTNINTNFRHQLIGASPTLTPVAKWLQDLKQRGIDNFASAGLPRVLEEDWKYTNIQYLNDGEWELADLPSNIKSPDWLVSGEVIRLCFVNGIYYPNYSELLELPDNNYIGPLDKALELEEVNIKDHLGSLVAKHSASITELNTANIKDGFVIKLSKLREPINVEILNINEGSDGQVFFHPRNLIVLDSASQVNLVERFIGNSNNTYFNNSTSEVLVQNGSNLRLYRVLGDGNNATTITNTVVSVGVESVFENLSLSHGGRLVRDEIVVNLDGIGSSAKLGGVYLASKDQHVDNTVLVDHKYPNSKSEQLFKGALAGSATGVFQGNIRVGENADGANGALTNRTVLLSEKARMNSKPRLEIYADDVQCSHGCTTGDLDKEALFYLRSRGIPLAEARSILVEGFLSEVLEHFDQSYITGAFKGVFDEWVLGV